MTGTRVRAFAEGLSVCRSFVAQSWAIAAISLASPGAAQPIDDAEIVLPSMVEIPQAATYGFSRASKYEITWREYAGAVRLGDCRPPAGHTNERGEWVGERTTRDDERFATTFPVTGLHREDITCYLAWLHRQTGRTFKLPSVAQWQWLAYGGRQDLFPWGHEPGTDRANIWLEGRPLFDLEVLGRQERLNALLPVGRFPPNEFGLHDVVGNVMEYIDDCEMARLGLSDQLRLACVVMGGYAPPVFKNPRLPERVFLLENDVTSTGVGFRIIE